MKVPDAVRDENKGDRQDVGKCHLERVTMTGEGAGRIERVGAHWAEETAHPY